MIIADQTSMHALDHSSWVQGAVQMMYKKTEGLPAVNAQVLRSIQLQLGNVE
ncbi:hypothetical protein [Paenibacillus sp. SN-8-1]|uniref:hypothetical protein n=1 Tax=Paenibacillus sp. SN-8-1 TaxID=3435409 RepID=UPI003D9A83B3